MKLLYSTPNIAHHIGHIKQVVDNDYIMKHHEYAPSVYDKHCSFIFKLHKKRHRNIISDMFNVVVMKSVNIGIIETLNYYYISLTLEDYNKLKDYAIDNSFIIKLNKLVRPLLYLKQPRSIFNTIRTDEKIPFNSNWNFNVLDDLRYMSLDYMNNLWKNELDRQEMNQLFKVTLWLKMPVYAAMDLMHDFPSVSGNKCHSISNPQFDIPNIPDKKISIRLSDIGPSESLNTDKIFVDISPKDLTYTNKYMYSDMKQKGTVNTNMLSMYTLTDTFLTLSIEQLSLFADPHYLEDKSYQTYLHGTAEMLLLIDNNMEFILNGKDRYL